jgi:hypothetical protein
MTSGSELDICAAVTEAVALLSPPPKFDCLDPADLSFEAQIVKVRLE